MLKLIILICIVNYESLKCPMSLLILIVQHGIISLSGLSAFSNVDKNTFPEALITDILMELTQI